MKFTISNLLWLIVASALLVGFCVAYWNQERQYGIGSDEIVTDGRQSRGTEKDDPDTLEGRLASKGIVIKDSQVNPFPQIIYSEEITATWTGNCVAITDGDSIKVLKNGVEEIKIRLASIDTPEKKQAFGTKAKEITGELCHGKTVTVHETGQDRWQRVLAFIEVDGLNVNAELIKQGLAWRYDDYSDDAELAEIQKTAREAKRGLWIDADPIAPWEFRKKQKEN